MQRIRLFLAALAVATLTLAPGPAAAGAPELGWSDLHDGGAQLIDDGYVALTDAAGNAVIAGVRTVAGGNADLLVRKLDRLTGELMWSYAYAEPAGNDMAVADMVIDHRGDILIAGYLSSCDS
jgi:hypothetical protein